MTFQFWVRARKMRISYTPSVIPLTGFSLVLLRDGWLQIWSLAANLMSMSPPYRSRDLGAPLRTNRWLNSKAMTAVGDAIGGDARLHQRATTASAASAPPPVVALAPAGAAERA